MSADPSTWEGDIEQLEALLWWDRSLDSLFASNLTPERYELFTGLDKAAGDLVAFAGFHFDALGAVERGQFTPSSHALCEWVGDADDQRRPEWTVLAMSAIAWCALLEGFLSAIGTSWIDDQVVARVRVRRQGVELDGEAAKRQLLGWMAPTGRGGGAVWLQRLSDITGVRIEPVLARALTDLVEVRNRAAHRWGTEGGLEELPSSTRLGAWLHAVQILGRRVCLATAPNPRHLTSRGPGP